MVIIKRTKQSKRKIRYFVILIILIFVVFIASTYAWFSTQKNVSINNLKGRVEVAEGLQISLDAKTWKQEIELGTSDGSGILTNTLEANWTNYDLGIGSLLINGTSYTTKNYRPLQNDINDSTDNSTGFLETVSSSGKLGSSTKIIPFYTGKYSGVALRKINSVVEASNCGYYAFDIYLMNTSKVEVDDDLQLNFNSVVREILKEGENDFGLKNCVRLALGLFSAEVPADSTQARVVSSTEEGNISQVAIWEPNFDQHSAYVMQQNDKLKEIAGNVTVNCAGLNTYAVKTGTAADSRIANTYSNSDENLEEQKVNQTSGNTQKVKLNDLEIDGNTTGVLNLIDTTGEKLVLKPNTISKLRVYVWIEGQDPDCVNWASHSSGIDLVLGLCKGSEVGATTESDEV